jgi:hypothetical protein
MSRTQYFAEKRAAAMAYLALTDRDDLLVKAASPTDGPFSVIVHLTGRRRKGLRQFAVTETGMPEVSVPADADRHAAATVRALAKAGPYPIPAVVLLFTLKGNSGYFTWVSEPPGDGGELVLHKRPAFRPLDADSLDEIVRAVDGWYDARYATVTASRA